MNRLQTDMVALYYLHRTSGGVRIEDVAEAMGLLIEDGLIRGWGLSQVDVDIIERAQNVTPLSAIQNIYSMVGRDVKKAVIPYCMEHGIGVVPFSPIASGLLSVRITTETKFERNDDVRNWVLQLFRVNIAERSVCCNEEIWFWTDASAADKSGGPTQYVRYPPSKICIPLWQGRMREPVSRSAKNLGLPMCPPALLQKGISATVTLPGRNTGKATGGGR